MNLIKFNDLLLYSIIIPFRSKSRDRHKDVDKAKQPQSTAADGESVGSSELDTTTETTTGVDQPAGGDSCTLARVILPDKSTTVVNTKGSEEETVRSLVSRLLEKRGLRYTSFDVFPTSGPAEKPIDLAANCSVLVCAEVRVEPRVLFR